MEYDNRDSGALFKNDKRGNEKAPDYTGEYTTPGNEKRRVAAWLRKSKKGEPYLSLKFSDMQRSDSVRPDYGTELDKAVPEDGFDDIPF